MDHESTKSRKGVICDRPTFSLMADRVELIARGPDGRDLMKVTWTTRRLVAVSVALTVFACTRGAAGQAVQLPTFHFFSLSTTVSVPDGGDAAFGGISRSSSGRFDRGVLGLPSRPFDNVATARGTGAGSVSAGATIHDFEAMEKALEGAGGGAQGAGGQGRGEIVRMPKSDAPVQSIAAIRGQQASEDAAKEREAAAALARGRQLLAEGKTSVAKIYLQTAVKKSAAESDVHSRALAVLRSI